VIHTPPEQIYFNILVGCAKKPIAKNLSIKACKKKTWEDKMRSVDALLPFLYFSILDDLSFAFAKNLQCTPPE